MGAWENTGTVLTEGLSARAVGRNPMGQSTLTQNLNKQEDGYGVVRALDPQTLEKKWDFPMNDITWGGVLTTAGDVLFSGGKEGYFFALDARSRCATLEGGARRAGQQRPHERFGQRPAVRHGGCRHRSLHIRVEAMTMTSRLLGSAVIAAAVAAVLTAQLGAQSAPTVRTHDAATHASFSPPRTIDGHPDMQGYWTNATYTPLERPTEFGTKEFLTREEAVAYAKRRDDQLRAQPRDNIHYDDAIWQSERGVKGLSSLRTSLIYDPPDGKIPPMTAEGQKRTDARAAARKLAGPADNAQMRTLGERCIMWPHEGPPMLPAGYFPNLQIVQGPGTFVIMQEIIHNARVIAYARPPAPRQGDSAGPAATRAAGGRATRWWSTPPTSTRRRSFADPRRR